jgi:hypothetical protein
MIGIEFFILSGFPGGVFRRGWRGFDGRLAGAGWRAGAIRQIQGAALAAGARQQCRAYRAAQQNASQAQVPHVRISAGIHGVSLPCLFVPHPVAPAGQARTSVMS